MSSDQQSLQDHECHEGVARMRYHHRTCRGGTVRDRSLPASSIRACDPPQTRGTNTRPKRRRVITRPLGIIGGAAVAVAARVVEVRAAVNTATSATPSVMPTIRIPIAIFPTTRPELRWSPPSPIVLIEPTPPPPRSSPITPMPTRRRSASWSMGTNRRTRVT